MTSSTAKFASDDSSARKDKIKLGVAIAIFMAAGGFAWYTLAKPGPESQAALRGFMCNECKQPFDHKLQLGDTEPLKCPNCGKQGGYQAELCFWASDGSGGWIARLKPTYVILNKRLNPESEEPTFCPDCGREVVGHNPRPSPEEMEAAKAASGG